MRTALYCILATLWAIFGFLLEKWEKGTSWDTPLVMAMMAIMMGATAIMLYKDYGNKR